MNITSGKVPLKAVKVVVYGPEGIGKSTFASKFPNPLFIDTEDSTKKLDVRRFDRPSSWQMLIDQIKYVKANPTICKTLIIDTADWAEKLCIANICAGAKIGGIEDFGYGKGYVYVEEEIGRLLNLLSEIKDIGINVVLTAHAAMRKFEQPDELGAYDRWEMKLSKKVSPLVKEWADMVLFANFKTFSVAVGGSEKNKKYKGQGGTQRVMYTEHNACWDAKNRDNLDPELPFDFAEIAHIIPSEQLAPPVAPHPVATPPTPEPPKSDIQLQINNVVDDEPEEGECTSNSVAAAEAEAIPQTLWDLMSMNNVTIEQIKAAVAAKGYYPEDTPLNKYDPAFINGVLIGAWGKVFELIKEMNAVPFK